jgi:hypothetical protein
MVVAGVWMALVGFPSFRVLSTLPAELRVEDMIEDFGGSE